MIRDNPRPRAGMLARSAPALVVLVAAAAVVLLACGIRPYPFATTDDNWMYFLPLIRAHTDAALHGTPLKTLWDLGAGWNPWENAQVGILYAPYHLSNLVARLLGKPLAILEVSAWLHLAAAGLIALNRTRGNRVVRIGWAGVAMFAPGPFLIGLNWHNYLSCYPWFLAIAFQLQGLANREPEYISRQDRLWLAFKVLGFYLSAHAQMYVIGLGLLALWVIADTPWRRALRTLLQTSFVLVPSLVPLLFLKVLSLDGTQDWMGDRNDPFYLLRHAQGLRAVLHGLFLGNLVPTSEFRLWAGISWVGIGMFFAPTLWLLALPAWRTRRWQLLVFFVACLGFMSAATFPFLRHLGVGPLSGFRWTWKIAIFVGPLALVSLAARWEDHIPKPMLRTIALAAINACSLAVCLRGLAFEIWPSLTGAHRLGAAGIVRETRAMASATGMAPGTRIALLGPFDMVQALPVPILGLTGNAPLLSGLQTAHIYEPMEPEPISQAHFGLSLPWRRIVPVEVFLAQPDRVHAALRSIGVQALVGSDPELGRVPGVRTYRDARGLETFVLPIPGANPGPYPFASPPGEVLPDGRLLVSGTTQVPRLLSPRPVRWAPSGPSTTGTPESIPLGWAFATLVASLAALLGLLFPPAILGEWPDAPRHLDSPRRAPPCPQPGPPGRESSPEGTEKEI